MNSIAIRKPSTSHARGIEIIIRKTQLLRINMGKIQKMTIDLRRSHRRGYAFDYKKSFSALRSPERSAFFVIKTAPVNGSRF